MSFTRVYPSRKRAEVGSVSVRNYKYVFLLIVQDTPHNFIIHTYFFLSYSPFLKIVALKICINKDRLFIQVGFVLPLWECNYLTSNNTTITKRKPTFVYVIVIITHGIHIFFYFSQWQIKYYFYLTFWLYSKI